MEQNKIQYFEKIEKKTQREFLNDHNNCILCGTVLELRHTVVEEKNEIREEAHCPECEMRTRAKTFGVH